MPLVPLLIFIAAAPATGSAPDPAQTKRLICRASELEVGSRIRHGRRCRTAQDWELEDARRDRKPADMRVTEGQQVVPGAAQSPH